jgi:hypothetical protein
VPVGGAGGRPAEGAAAKVCYALEPLKIRSGGSVRATMTTSGCSGIRSAQWAAVADRREPFDVIVIGGGATGLGVAVDAAARGFAVALFEAEDFAKGTSSRATKLVHGGVRYLAQGNLGLVREALRERALLLANADHLVAPLPFILPTYGWRGRLWDRWFYGAGLLVYGLLAGRAALGRTGLPGRRRLLASAPGLEPVGLAGGVSYVDGQFDDARLAVALARTGSTGWRLKIGKSAGGLPLRPAVWSMLRASGSTPFADSMIQRRPTWWPPARACMWSLTGSSFHLTER